MKGISVVIPNYNGEILLPAILPCLYAALDNTKLAYEVILVDDCSTDNTTGFLKQNYPTIILLENERNKGFSPTINKGIFSAQYDLVLLLNSDVKLTPNYFEKQLAYFENEDTFGVMGRIVGWDNDTIQDGGKYPTMQGVKIKTSTNYIPTSKYDNLYSMYLSGANALVCRKKLIQLGGFNELFAPFYIEDVELSIRAWRMGWICYYEHSAICKHKTSTTIKTKESKNYVKAIYYRNKMFLHAIHLPNNKLWLWYIQLFTETFVQTLLGKFYFIKALKMFFSLKKEMLDSKNKLGTNNLIPIKDLINLIVKSLEDKVVKTF